MFYLTKKLGEIAETSSGGTPRTGTKEYWGGDIPWLRSGELVDGEIYKTEKMITERGLKESSAKMFPKNSVLIALTGATVGKTGILRINSATNQSVVGIFPNEKKIVPEFIWYFLRLNYPKIKAKAYGGAQPHIDQGDVKNLKIPLPPLQTQKQIVERLDKIAEAQKLQGELIQKSDELFRSLLHSLIRANSRIENWPIKKLGDVLEYEQPTKYLVSSTNYKDEYPIPVLTAGKSFILGNTNEKDDVFPKEKLPVIIFDDFTTAIKFVDFPFKVKSSAMKILHAKTNEADIKYLFNKLLTIKFSHNQHKRYWISECSKLEIPLPPLKIQKQIVAKLSAAQNYKTQLLAQKSKLKELFDSALAKSFSEKR